MYRADFERVANDARLREKLRSERLQEVIRSIDEAVDGGKALERANGWAAPPVKFKGCLIPF